MDRSYNINHRESNQMFDESWDKKLSNLKPTCSSKLFDKGNNASLHGLQLHDQISPRISLAHIPFQREDKEYYHPAIHNNSVCSNMNSNSNTDNSESYGQPAIISKSFPFKLHQLLTSAEKEGFSDVISWNSHGQNFRIHNGERFFKEVIPKYFKHSKQRSFYRQLNLYGFSCIKSGADRGGYFHEFFLRGRLDLCKQMHRTSKSKKCQEIVTKTGKEHKQTFQSNTNRSQFSENNSEYFHRIVGDISHIHLNQNPWKKGCMDSTRKEEIDSANIDITQSHEQISLSSKEPHLMSPVDELSNNQPITSSLLECSLQSLEQHRCKKIIPPPFILANTNQADMLKTSMKSYNDVTAPTLMSSKNFTKHFNKLPFYLNDVVFLKGIPFNDPDFKVVLEGIKKM